MRVGGAAGKVETGSGGGNASETEKSPTREGYLTK